MVRRSVLGLFVFRWIMSGDRWSALDRRVHRADRNRSGRHMRLAQCRFSQRCDATRDVGRSRGHPALQLQAQGGAWCANNRREGEDKGFAGHPAQPGRVDRLIQRRSFPGRASARGLPRKDSHSSRLAGPLVAACRGV
jgi:hypothetical protein